MKREQTKIFSRDGDASEGSFWELCVFAVFFVVVFTLLARTAHADPLKTSAGKSSRSSLAQNSSSRGSDTSVSPLRGQALPSAIPSGALPNANVAASLPEPTTNKRYGWTTKLTVDTSIDANSQERDSYAGEYLATTGVTDQKTNIAGILKFGYDREYSFEQKDGRDGDYVDPSIAVTKTWKDGLDFKSPVFDTLVVGVSSVVGASRESARRTFLGSMGPTVGATKQIHKLSIGQKFGYQRKFYNYDIRNDGTVNSPDQVSSTTDLSFAFTKSLSISAETILFYALNYQGHGTTTEWSALSLDWEITKLLSTSIGLATRRGTVSDDGTFDQVKFIDGAVTQGFFDVILNF